MRKFLEWILIAVVVGATLAFGGVQPLTYSLMEITLFAAMLILLAVQTLRGKIDIPLPIWILPFLALVILQLVPLPAKWVLAISPGRFLWHDPLSASSSALGWASISISPHDTVVALLKLLAYLCAFVLAAYTFDFRSRKSIVLRGLIALACFETVYGLFQYLTQKNYIFGYENQFGAGLATGTYINRNHYAGFLELTFPLILGFSFYKFQMWNESRHRRGPSGNTEAANNCVQALFFAFLFVLAMVAMIFSTSRGGILASLLTIIAICVLVQLRVRRKILGLGLAAAVLTITSYGLWIGLGPVLSRFEEFQSPSLVIRTEGRFDIWQDSLRLLRKNPLVGTGLGTFEKAYRPYQTIYVQLLVDHAHNDFLEAATDTGVVGATLLFVPILGLAIKMIVAFLDDTRRYRRSVTLGCIGGSMAILLHSSTDFNLHIPANALIFSILLGIGYKNLLTRSDTRSSQPIDKPQSFDSFTDDARPLRLT